MNSNTAPIEYTRNWLNTIVLFTTPLLAIIIVPSYGFNIGFSYMDWTFFGLFMYATGLSITGGYHRLWSHKSYEANSLVRFFYAYWGACSTQNTILKWSSDHRDHHKFVDDNEKDPYSAKKGFWWSHLGWVLVDRSVPNDLSNVKDLRKEKIIMWQHKYYLPLVLFSNLVVPFLLGYISYGITGTGSVWGTFILAGLLRFVMNHHFTFFINSACHIFGKQPYSNKDTSKDNFLLALFTYGEGFHNYHHTFQADYRNGIKWFHFDPTKWLIKSLNYVGMTTKLKQMSEAQILKQITTHSMALSKEKLYKRLEIVADSKIAQDIEASHSDFSESLTKWYEANQRYARLCKDKTVSSEDKQTQAQKQAELRLSFETKQAKLVELFSAKTTAVLSV